MVEFVLTEPQDVIIKITDVLGKMVYSEEWQQLSGEFKTKINIGTHATGMYNLEIITERFIKAEKLIIK